jgi:hypothetical protein
MPTVQWDKKEFSNDVLQGTYAYRLSGRAWTFFFLAFTPQLKINVSGQGNDLQWLLQANYYVYLHET